MGGSFTLNTRIVFRERVVTEAGRTLCTHVMWHGRNTFASGPFMQLAVPFVPDWVRSLAPLVTQSRIEATLPPSAWLGDLRAFGDTVNKARAERCDPLERRTNCCIP